MRINPAIIKAYDIRGLYPFEINKETAFLLGRAYAAFLQKKLRKKRVALSIGRDLRFSSDELARFFTQGATEAGADVIDIGEVTTPLNYFAVSHLRLDGGAMITASHNGPEYNGIKFIVRKGRGMFQIGKEQGLSVLPALARKKIRNAATGIITKREVRKNYVDFLLRIVPLPRFDVFTKLKIVVDASGGSAIIVLPELLSRIGITYKPLFFERDPHFKKHSPNPLKPESQRFVQEELKKGGYAFGVVFDGDADRVQFFDERGRAVPNGSMLGVLAGAVLGQKKRLNQSAKPIGRPNDLNRFRESVVVLDPFISLGVEEYIRERGGVPQRVSTGTAFIKEGMKKYKALLGGEYSGHFYFREFFGSDSAFVAFLSVLKIAMREKKIFSALTRPCERYVSRFTDLAVIKGRAGGITRAIGAYYKKKGANVKKFDGLGISFPDWRAHIRPSNTEPVLRVFVEAKSEEVLEEKMKELLSLLKV
ncbi:MAG: phosphomannomutase/phosphoglucomutase [bacterium]|nr:phosphomannomutase/phosphoglucomutase [bacterium]